MFKVLPTLQVDWQPAGICLTPVVVKLPKITDDVLLAVYSFLYFVNSLIITEFRAIQKRFVKKALKFLGRGIVVFRQGSLIFNIRWLQAVATWRKAPSVCLLF